MLSFPSCYAFTQRIFPPSFFVEKQYFYKQIGWDIKLNINKLLVVLFNLCSSISTAPTHFKTKSTHFPRVPFPYPFPYPFPRIPYYSLGG